MRHLLLIVCCIYSTVILADQGGISSFESEGNLESTHSIDCVDWDGIRTDYTPADLFPASKRCIDQDDYTLAAQLYLVARIYTAFDAKRVADSTAHQAGMVLRLNVFGDLSAKSEKALSAALGEQVEGEALCGRLTELGHPTYHPGYMIQHGMGAFTGSHSENNGLIEGFDSAAVWKELTSSVCEENQPD